MTNQAILTILDYICNDASHLAQATLGSIELDRDFTAGVPLRSYLENNRNCADRLLRSIDDIRDLFAGSPPTGKAAENFDVAQCIGQAIDLLNLAAGENSRRIVLAASVKPLMISQDRHIVEQALTRLLDAAMKLGIAGDVRVAIATGPGGDGVRVAITPPNPGLAAHLLDWLNSDPDQIDFQDSSAVAAAVGVVVAGKRLRSLSGTFELVRPPSDAARLAIVLPSQPNKPDGPNFLPSTHAVGYDPLNVLIVQDCDDSFALSEVLFQNENVCRALNGPEAIDFVQRHRFDAVFMDVHMPGMDGYAAIRAIRNWETKTASVRTPIVVLSSDDIETEWRSAAQSGCSGFLRKPLRNNEIPDLLQRLREARAGVC